MKTIIILDQIQAGLGGDCPQIVYDDCIYSIYINNNAPDNKKLKVFSYKF